LAKNDINNILTTNNLFSFTSNGIDIGVTAVGVDKTGVDVGTTMVRAKTTSGATVEISGVKIVN
jgi:hypothetical protein